MIIIRKNMILAILCSVTCMLVTGCSGLQFQTNDGVKHHLIIGIGMVSIKEQSGISVEDVKSLGISLGKGGFNLGVGQQHYVEIDPKTANEAVISIHTTPYSLKVTNFIPYSYIHSINGGYSHEKEH